MSNLKVETLRDGRALCALEGDWWALWHRAMAGPSLTAAPFVSPAWLLPWWQVFRPGRLLSVALWDRDRLVALAPGYIEEGPSGRRLLPVGTAISDYLDVLIDPDYPAAGDVLMEALDAEEGWDTLSLEELPPASCARTVPCLPHWQESSERQSACPVVRLPATIERLGEVVPTARLHKLRTARNRARRRGGYVAEQIEAPDVDRFLRELFRLHGARWASRGESGVLDARTVQRFHSLAAPALLAAGMARFYVLGLEGRAVAAYYGLCAGRRAFGYLSGFDPAYAFESPGAVMVGHAIEAAVAEGCAEYHFLRGRESYKYDWGAVDVWSVRRTFVREPAYA